MAKGYSCEVQEGSEKGQEQVSWNVRCDTGDTMDTQYVMDAAMSMQELLDCLGPSLSPRAVDEQFS